MCECLERVRGHMCRSVRGGRLMPVLKATAELSESDSNPFSEEGAFIFHYFPQS